VTSGSNSDEPAPDDATPIPDAEAITDVADAPQSVGKGHAPSATPEETKSERHHVSETASRHEGGGRLEPVASLSQLAASDSAPQGKPADGAQIVTAQQQTDRPGNTAAPATPAPSNPPTAVPLTGLAIEIAARAQTGRNRFEIRLDPPELGRIHVHLDVDNSGHVTSHLVVDRVETLDALRRDAADLERALQQAGLKTSDSGLQFSLRDQSFTGRDDRSTPADMARVVVSDPDLAPVEATPASYGRLSRSGGGIDIRV
jgi:chemotaxis protein MotD